MTRDYRPQPAHIIFICLCTLAFYAASVDNYWIKDDLNLGQITNGTSTLDWGTFSRYAWPSHMTHDEFWRPVPVLLGYFDFAMWGNNPSGFHIVNIALHALNGILVYLLLNRLTGFRRPGLGFIAALLFVVNPIAPESIIWVLQRMVLMCTLFSLWALLFWLKGVESGRTAPRVAAMLLLVLAILSKEIGATLPACFFALDLFWAPQSMALSKRLRRALAWAAPCAAILGVYLACRWLLFGRLTISYGEMEPMEYARHNRVFQLMATSLRNCILPVNASVFSDSTVKALRGMMLLGYGLAASRGLYLLWCSNTFRRLVALCVVFLVVSFAPTLLIFWVDEDLFNARFFYQPSIALIMLAAAALWLPARGKDVDFRRSPMGIVGSAALVVAFSVSLGQGLGAFEDASKQVRGIQQALVARAQKTKGTPAMVALWTPSRVDGVPTLEWSLVQAMKPPFIAKPITTIPLLDVFANTETWPEYLSTRIRNEQIQLENLRYVRCEFNPPGITDVFPASTEAIGGWPCALLLPRDGTFLRNNGDEPTFRFQPVGEVSRFRLRLDWMGATDPVLINIVVGRNATQDSHGRISYRLSGKDALDSSIPDLWKDVVQKPHAAPLGILWRIESLDSGGDIVGVSQTRRLLIFSINN